MGFAEEMCSKMRKCAKIISGRNEHPIEDCGVRGWLHFGGWHANFCQPWWGN